MRQSYSFKYDIDDDYDSYERTDTDMHTSDINNFDEAYKEIFKNPKDEIFSINSDSMIINNNIISKEENNISSIKPKPLFKIQKNGNRGRKRSVNNLRKKHDAYSTDNILNKIQRHYFNFIIKFINDCNKNIYPNQKMQLRKFDGKQKAKVSKDYLENLKKSTIYDLLFNMDISEKYTRSVKNINKKYLKAFSKDIWLNNIFNMNFLDLFKVYYNYKQPLKEYYIYNEKYETKKIIVSSETKSFYYLLEKEKNLKDNMNEIVEKNYINKRDINKLDRLVINKKNI